MADPAPPPGNPGDAAAISAVVRRPFTEQVAFFRRKLDNLVPTQRWDDMVGAAHDDGFMVAGAMDADLLTDLAAAVDKAIAEGSGIEAFRKDFRAIVANNGWTGYTGAGTVKGEAWRVGVILRTNASTSYSAGRHAQLLSGDFKYWVYRHGNSREPRPEHLSWNGWAGPPSHPFWVQHYPPSDWGCSCYVLGASSDAAVKRLGGDLAKQLPAGWDKVDRATGAQVGIGKGWGYAPGASMTTDARTGAEVSVAQLIGAIAGKVGNWDYGVAKAFMAGLPVERADALGAAYRALPSTADDARRFAAAIAEERLAPADKVVRSLGMVDSEQISMINAATRKSIERPDFRLDADAVRHVLANHGDDAAEALRGQRAVAPADFARLPRILSAPDSIERPGTAGGGETVVNYVKQIDGETFTAVMTVNAKRRALALKTLYVRKRRRR